MEISKPGRYRTRNGGSIRLDIAKDEEGKPVAAIMAGDEYGHRWDTLDGSYTTKFDPGKDIVSED